MHYPYGSELLSFGCGEDGEAPEWFRAYPIFEVLAVLRGEQIVKLSIGLPFEGRCGFAGLKGNAGP